MKAKCHKCPDIKSDYKCIACCIESKDGQELNNFESLGGALSYTSILFFGVMFTFLVRSTTSRVKAA